MIVYLDFIFISPILTIYSDAFFTKKVFKIICVIIILLCHKIKVTLMIKNQDTIFLRISTERQF